MIQFDKVSVIEDRIRILDEISFELKDSEKISLTGPSGSGKTSILLTLLGVYIPKSGRVLFDGEELTEQNIGKIRSSIAYVSQEPLLGNEKVMDSILLPFSFKINASKRPSREQIIDVLKQLELEQNILEKDVAVISGGEKQRLTIARSLLLGKNIFLLDEVTSALDPESKKVVISLFSEQKYTILSISHDQEWIDNCSRILKMNKGRISN